MPTFAFAPENLDHFKETEEFHDEEKRALQLSTIEGKNFREYRLPQETWEKINKLLQKYVGTKNYHNYTSKM